MGRRRLRAHVKQPWYVDCYITCNAKRMEGSNHRSADQLLKIAAGATVEPSEKRRMPITQVGSQLVREWNGKTHTVIVTDKGYALNGITYSSLSAAAKAITGAHWSGPRFFGVAS
jgi:hypothetical protein